MRKAALKNLHLQVTSFLEKALLPEATVSYQDSMIKIVITREEYEQRFGALLLRIQQLIDEKYPSRTSDITILIRDSGSRFEHVFKIWKSPEL